MQGTGTACTGCQLLFRSGIQTFKVEDGYICESCYSERKLLYARLNGSTNDSVVRNRLLYHSENNINWGSINITAESTTEPISKIYSRHPRVLPDVPKRNSSKLKRDTALTRRLINTHPHTVKDVVLTTDGTQPKELPVHWKPNTLSDNAGGSLAAMVSPCPSQQGRMSEVNDSTIIPPSTVYATSSPAEDVSYYQRWKQSRKRSSTNHKDCTPPRQEPVDDLLDSTFPQSSSRVSIRSASDLHVTSPAPLKLDSNGGEYVVRLLLQTHGVYQHYKELLEVECKNSLADIQLVGVTEVSCPNLQMQAASNPTNMQLSKTLFLGTHERLHKEIFSDGIGSIQSELMVVSASLLLAASFGNSKDQSVEDWQITKEPDSQNNIKVIALKMMGPYLVDADGFVELDAGAACYPEYVIEISEVT
eukprot:TRINITY_DN15150_c0_g1_i1.p1 TRINITY_DN15150_c0_g1~~TRINITY_DN15150_c0_g1_i1.p1  ORF type:complete len:419 (+),score=61.44 TRINITY_DN15150_c0_g1_i1:46-1302(+)